MNGGACPCCGQSVPESRLYVSLSNNTAALDGKTVKLSVMHARILAALSRAWPAPCEHETIWQSVWGDRPAENERNTITVHLSKMDRELEALGIGIKNVRAVGYRLVLPGEATIDRHSVRRRQ